ncbi:DUF5412 family protein [Gorillibacterium sp. sgz500922]|uniref:DUF5412 family protein n=1 Tax=Gorillibacterium sp. sgz500922 TaxID=3446694 RepID=UPI003F681C1A
MNVSAFGLSLLCSAISAYSLYSYIYHTWLIAPPNVVLFGIALAALILGAIGFKDRSSRLAKWRSWTTTILSGLLIVLLCLVMAFTSMFSGAKTKIKTVQSPDGAYTLDFFYTNAGAMGPFGVLGERNGPLWFKKVIFYEERVDQVEVEWVDNHTVVINKVRLDLSAGDTSFN